MRRQWRLAGLLLPDWMADKRPDPNHFYRRCFTPRHRAKRGIVRNVWIGAAVIVLSHPVPAVMMIVGLGASLLSFMILDESQ
jgi:hypothetical protein